VKTASIEQVSDGVFTAIAAEGGVAVGNAGSVDLGGEALVFDAHLTLFAGRELRTAAERHAPVDNVVLSHWHGDHVYGAGAFDATVVATARTAELMRERTAQRLAEFKAAPPEDSADTLFASSSGPSFRRSSSTTRTRPSTPSAASPAPHARRA
jgi:glyoxylase-like metal-dependent hydrolase (beta-lactamase superfamily II)